jgi:DNA gyrase/topoisomerase IV subunit A
MNGGSVRQVNIDDEMRVAYLDYAMSVIVARTPAHFVRHA